VIPWITNLRAKWESNSSVLRRLCRLVVSSSIVSLDLRTLISGLGF
jgi:hypothetical protein